MPEADAFRRRRIRAGVFRGEPRTKKFHPRLCPRRRRCARLLSPAIAVGEPVDNRRLRYLRGATDYLHVLNALLTRQDLQRLTGPPIEAMRATDNNLQAQTQAVEPRS